MSTKPGEVQTAPKVITAATPIMIPRAVRTERILLDASARNATLKADQVLIAIEENRINKGSR